MSKTFVAIVTVGSVLLGVLTGIVTSAVGYGAERQRTQGKIEQLERDRDVLQRRVDGIDLALVRQRLDVIETVLVSEHPAYSAMIYYRR